jgi:hypothetical protein
MNEYYVVDTWTGEYDILYGYTWEDALERARLENIGNRYTCWRVD